MKVILLDFQSFMRKILLVVVLVLSATMSQAGTEKFQITWLLSPTVEWLHFGKGPNVSVYNTLWGKKLSYNFGVEYKRFVDPSLSFSIGLMYMNKGFRNHIYSYDGVSEAGITLGSTHIVAMPVSVNVHHNLRRKVEMIYTAGLSGGYVFSETVRSKLYTDEQVPTQGILDFKQGKSNVNLFVDYYIGAHAGVGISAYVKSRWVMILQPMLKVQLNNARDYAGQFASSDYFTTHLNSFGIDFKLGYFFTKQFRNRTKEY